MTTAITPPEKFTATMAVDPRLPEIVDISIALNIASRQWEDTVKAGGYRETGPPMAYFERDLAGGQACISVVGWVRPITAEARQAAARRAMEATTP